MLNDSFLRGGQKNKGHYATKGSSSVVFAQAPTTCIGHKFKRTPIGNRDELARNLHIYLMIIEFISIILKDIRGGQNYG